MEACATADDGFGNLVAVCPLPFVEWNPALHVTCWSPAAETQFGWRAADVVGCTCEEWRFIPASERGRSLDTLKAALGGQSSHPVFQGRIKNRDGETITCRWHIGTRPDGTGQIRGLFAYIVPCTDSDDPARASAQNWQRFFRGSKLGLALHDTRSNRVLEANPAYARLHGYTIEELRGKRIDELYPESEQEALRFFLQRADAEGEISFESVHLRRDGSTFPVLMGMTSITDEQGVPVERYVSLIDISDRKTAEERLRVLSQAIEQSPESIVITNTLAEIEYVNSAFTRKSGYTMDEVLGKNPRILHSGKTPRATHLSLWDSLSKGEPWTGEFCNRSKHGDEYFERATISPIHDDKGAISHYVAIKQDITEQRRLTEELARYREQLEHLVEQRTRELREALHAASTASRSKSDFLATMSHEIRTPMNGVLGIVDVLAHTPLTEDQQELVSTMRQSAESLLSLIDDILDFSKIEAGHLALDIQPEQTEAMLDEILDTLQPLAVAQRVDLRVFAHPGIPSLIRCDRLRLRQIIFNLAGNALKFSSGQARRGQVIVRIEVSDEQKLRLSVADNGIGMTPEQLDTVFEPFRQAEHATTRRFGGTGLGLTITQRLVDAFGGRIQIDSTPGSGTLVCVDLPLETVDSAEEAAEQALAGTHCVIALSDASAAHDWQIYLCFAGADVSIAADLEDAIQRIADASGSKRVLITDSPLPAHQTDSWRRLSVTGRAGLIVVGHGIRQNPREEAERTYSIDLEAARRRNLVEAVRLASSAEPGSRTLGPEARSNSGRYLERKLITPALSARLAPVLVVEDHDINRKIIGRQLELLGLRYFMAGNGLEALQALESADYSLMLTDLHMPEMDGYTLTRTVRSSEPGERRLPIIAVTANALRGEEQHCLEVGMDAFLVKPVQLEALAHAIASVLPPQKDQPTSSSQMTVGAQAEQPARQQIPALEPSTPALLDPAILRELVGGDPDMVLEFLEAYATSARRTADEILDAIAREDWSGASGAAHKLKSASRSVGANALGELCATMETLARASDANAMQALLPRFEPLVLDTLRLVSQTLEPTESGTLQQQPTERGRQ